MGIRKATQIVLLLLLGCMPGCRTSAPVLMVCEHGSVKSLMAASLFNQTAAERGLPFRAIARGVNPDPSVPAPVAEALAQDGFDVKGFVPARFSAAEVASASRVIAIGVDPAVLSAGAEVSINTWSEVPAASVDYSAAKASLQRYIDALLSELQQQGVHGH